MGGESLFERPSQRDEHERNDRHCQYRMREENREINRAHPTQAFKRHGPDSVVVDEIGNQKKTRATEGRKHARFVRLDVFELDEKKSENQKRGADGIQRRVNGG